MIKRRRKSPEILPISESAASTILTARSRTLVFISHDSRDADLAEAFANLLSDVSAGTLKSFRSSDKKGTSGIEFGTEWYNAIMTQLGDATDVVALLTQHSVGRPWILYEAGVAKGKLDTNVLGIALGVPLEKVSSGPFGQFQNCGDDEDSLTTLVIQLLSRNPDAAPREEAVRRQVSVFLAQTKQLLIQRGKGTAKAEPEESSAAKLFEEVKAMVRDLPDRVDDRVRASTKRGGLKHRRRLHPGVFDEFILHPELQDSRHGQATAWLIFLWTLHEDFPWLQEMGRDIYHALRRGNMANIASLRRELVLALEVMCRGPFLREFSRSDDEELHYFARHLPETVDRFLSQLVRKTPSKSKRERLLEADEKGT